ncbi:MAG: hypothetical protein GXP49_08155 [Deltaproteobacteria bacterium]|nr:hypothetical protein [Deltaproteobacteria bacterium]
MRMLMLFVDRLKWVPTTRGLDQGSENAEQGEVRKAVAGFIHIEPKDQDNASKVETKLVKNLKWLAGKWDTKLIVLHSFSHLAEAKADPQFARDMLSRAKERIEGSGYQVVETPYGWFNNLDFSAPGVPLARVFKEF